MIMLKRMIGRLRFNNYKRLLAEGSDLRIDEIHSILHNCKEVWIKMDYNPSRVGGLSTKLYYNSVEDFDDSISSFYEKIQKGEYLNIATDLNPKEVAIDDWLTDKYDVPVIWNDYIKHIINIFDLINTTYMSLPEKKKVFYHRNSTHLREDMSALLLLMSKL